MGRHWRLAGWGAAAALLLLPLLGRLITDEFAWGLADYAIAAVLFVSVGIALELAARRAASRAYLAAVAVTLAAAVLLVWINLAVGVIGSEANPANLMYAAVLLVALMGAVLARFRPAGMARALLFTALAQATVGAVTLILRLDFALPIDAFFAALWLTAAWLFHSAARGQPRR